MYLQDVEEGLSPWPSAIRQKVKVASFPELVLVFVLELLPALVPDFALELLPVLVSVFVLEPLPALDPEEGLLVFAAVFFA